MDPQIVQNIRYKLQKRVSRLRSVDTQILFMISLLQFWKYFDKQSMLIGVISQLSAEYADIDSQIDGLFSDGDVLYGETEEEAAYIGYKVLRRLSESTDERVLISLLRKYNPHSGLDELLETVRELFLEPFYEFIDEQIDEQRATLSLIYRYKHRSEWFHRDALLELSRVERLGEKKLSLNLYSYLYDKGIDFSIEPSSITGEIDLISAQKSDDPLLLDVKIFDGNDRGKAYIRKGFGQIYTYTQQHNEAFGYLLIFNVSERQLRFSLKIAGNVPQVTYNHKTIFIVTIDIFAHEKPVSQRKPISAIEIAEEELIETIPDAVKKTNETD